MGWSRDTDRTPPPPHLFTLTTGSTPSLSPPTTIHPHTHQEEGEDEVVWLDEQEYLLRIPSSSSSSSYSEGEESDSEVELLEHVLVDLVSDEEDASVSPPSTSSHSSQSPQAGDQDMDLKEEDEAEPLSPTPSTFSTTSTITIHDTDYDVDGVYGQNRFNFDPVTLVKWEHSYALPLSPPPQPDAATGQEQAHALVPLRRSARSTLQLSTSRIRRIVEDLRSDDDDEEAEAAELRATGSEGGGGGGGGVWAGDVSGHADWRWELEEYGHYLRLAPSSIESNGVFAKHTIPPQVCIVEYKGQRIPTSDVDVREAGYRARGILHDYMFRINETLTIDATLYFSNNLAKFINHSCQPNAYSCEMVIGGRRRIVLVSLREIAEGEEITYDYLFPPELDPSKRIVCNCHAPNCRGFIN